jgi:hypothetical protein
VEAVVVVRDEDVVWAGVEAEPENNLSHTLRREKCLVKTEEVPEAKAPERGGAKDDAKIPKGTSRKEGMGTVPSEVSGMVDE